MINGKRIAELVLMTGTDPKDMQDLVTLARHGLWAIEHAIPALDYISREPEPGLEKLEDFQHTTLIAVITSDTKRAQEALKHKP